MSARDTAAAAAHLAKFLEALGVGDGDPEMAQTPKRVAQLYAALLAPTDPLAPDLSAFPNPNADGSPVLIRGVRFHSMCAHHLLPFFGHIDIAYIPGALVGGVGAFPRVVRYFAARPQVQERLVREITDHLEVQLAPMGLLVSCTARQLCMEMRGARAVGELTCSAATGSLAVGGAMRAEVLAALGQ